MQIIPHKLHKLFSQFSNAQGVRAISSFEAAVEISSMKWRRVNDRSSRTIDRIIARRRALNEAPRSRGDALVEIIQMDAPGNRNVKSHGRKFTSGGKKFRTRRHRESDSPPSGISRARYDPFGIRDAPRNCVMTPHFAPVCHVMSDYRLPFFFVFCLLHISTRESKSFQFFLPR